MKAAYVKFYPSDWTSGTYSLTPTEYYVYHRILCDLWDTGEPKSPNHVRRMFPGLSKKELDSALATLTQMGKLRAEDGALVNERALETHRLAVDGKRKRVDAANKRWHP